MKYIYSLFMIFSCLVSKAQLPSGSIAPDFTIEDLDGNTWNLYDILDQGKSVFLDMSATWCLPCWNFHESKAFEELYNAYGPAGTDELMVFTIEVDPQTNVDCITNDVNCNNSTFGDWTFGISYPFFNNDTIEDLYNVGYYPTIYHICPDRRITELDAVNADALYDNLQICNVPTQGADIGILDYSVFEGEFCGIESFIPTVNIQNLGTDTVTSLEIKIFLNDELTQSHIWSGVLSTFQFEYLTFDEIILTEDAFIKIEFTKVNNENDVSFSDNVLLAEATLSKIVLPNNEIILELKTDNNPGETYWEITNEAGDIIYTDGNGKIAPINSVEQAYNQANFNYQYVLNLPQDDCYSFSIYDQFGDGLCCADGNGYYRLYESGELVIEGGSFGNKETRRFLLEGTSGINNNIAFIDTQNQTSDNCGESTYKPEVNIKNLGINEVNAIDFEIVYNSQVIDTYSWSGSLEPFKENQITFNEINIVEFPEVEIHIAKVNDQVDSYEYNNIYLISASKTLTKYNSIDLQIQLDAYAYEVYWELINMDGQIFATGGNLKVGPDGGGKGGALPFDDGAYESGYLVEESILLPSNKNDCYLVRIIDSGGDGIAGGMATFLTLSDDSGIFFEKDFSAIPFEDHDIPFETQLPNQLKNLENTSWSIFPNPTTSNFSVRNNSSFHNWSIELYDIQGKMIMKKSISNNEEIDMSSFDQGLYYLRFSNSSKTEIKSVIKY